MEEIRTKIISKLPKQNASNSNNGYDREDLEHYEWQLREGLKGFCQSLIDLGFNSSDIYQQMIHVAHEQSEERKNSFSLLRYMEMYIEEAKEFEAKNGIKFK